MRERGWKGEVQYQLVIISGSLVIGGERERVEGGSTISIGNHFGVTGDRR